MIKYYDKHLINYNIFKHKNIYTGKETISQVYHSNNNSTKHIYILSGGVYCYFDKYMEKMLHDLYKYKTSIANNYKIFVITNDDTVKLFLEETIAKIIKHEINHNYKPVEEIILLGFSAGGFILSQSLARLKDIKCKKKLITYDSPHHLLKTFTHNINLNMNLLTKYYTKKFNHDCDGTIEDLLKILLKSTNLSKEQLFKSVMFNYDMGDNVSYYCIYNKYDPIVEYDYVNYCIIKNYDKLKKYNPKLYPKNYINHCTDMYFSITYLDQICNILLEK